MNNRGFLAPHNCGKCGALLQGEDSGRPAELYAGTYTGLCYSCQNSSDFVAKIEGLDEARYISTPPSCPSWRRDRESYIAYSDCIKCKGIGYSWVSRSNSVGGSYRHYCEECLKKHTNHPIRIKYSRISKKIYNKFNKIYNSVLEKEKKVTKSKNIPDVRARELAAPILNQYDKKISKLHEIYDKILQIRNPD
jgi:hypothetical protein